MPHGGVLDGSRSIVADPSCADQEDDDDHADAADGSAAL